ncbi:TniQ family protein [Vibrio sp. Isolate34]|uniref:TniQ family protein n=1 Tax=Vibrio sp. Isolate34 TaxID=2908540 RepID=UPI001EFC93A6|nr:TniQ family protein [Vibrio sp. Isolate34]MCG9642111.1 TniQ family protein [Vibrio sp. Isolate34]
MLLQRPKPHSNESLESFFIRVANKNGYEDVNRFLMATKRYLQDIDFSGFQTFPTNICKMNPASAKSSSSARIASLLKLAQLTFNEPPELLGLAINRTNLKYSPSTSAVIRGSEVFPRSLLRTKSIPYCPLCLQQNGYASYLWHFEGYDHCHIHNTPLITACSCGSEFDYRESGLKGNCSNCKEPIAIKSSEVSHEAIFTVANWLAGNESKNLPNVPKSYRWGLVHWWLHLNDNKFDHLLFTQFFSNWPSSFHSMIDSEIEFNVDHAIVGRKELRVKDLMGRIFFSSIRLPERNLQHNIVLGELLRHIETHLWNSNGLIANLRMNALEAAVFLNCSMDEVASMVEQRILKPNRKTKPNMPLAVNDYLFYFGDIFCLWLAEFQTDEFNRSFYVSRW